MERQFICIYNPLGRVAQLYPQAPGIHFDRLLRHTWAAMGFSFFGHHTGNLVTCKGMYKGVSKSCRTVLVKRSLFTLDVKFLHRLQSTPFCTNTAVPAFLPCLEASLEVPFWNCVKYPMRFLLNLFNGVESSTLHPKLQLGEEEKVTGGQIG